MTKDGQSRYVDSSTEFLTIETLVASACHARPGAPSRYAFDPGEPRVPAGSPEGGEWAEGGGGGKAALASRIDELLKGHDFRYTTGPEKGRPIPAGRVPIHELRAASGLSRQEFDAELNRLRQAGVIDFVTLSDMRDMTPEQAAAGIRGVGETFGYVEKHQEQNFDFARPGAPERFAFDPGEPRVPPGSAEGGEWTAGGDGADGEGDNGGMKTKIIPAPPAGSKPIADASRFGGETRFRMSSVGVTLPTGWSYGDANDEDELQEGFQVWDDLARFAHAAAEESDDGDYSLGAGYDTILLVNASRRKRHAGGNFWSAVSPEDVNHVWAIPTADFVDWLKSASGTWDESEGRFIGLRDWTRTNEDAISGWLDAHARPVEAQAEETIGDESED